MFIRNGLVLTFALAWTSFAIGFGPQEASQDAATIRRVQEAMQANRDGFTEFRVEFEITSGLVASEDEALKGNFTQGEQATASWTRRGDDETYRIVFRPLDLEKPADEMPLRPARKGGGDIEIPLGSSAKDIC